MSDYAFRKLQDTCAARFKSLVQIASIVGNDFRYFPCNIRKFNSHFDLFLYWILTAFRAWLFPSSFRGTSNQPMWYILSVCHSCDHAC